MAVGRISGPLLKDNLLRNGVNLAFETSLLYLDVKNGRVGINNAAPLYQLDVIGTTQTTNIEAANQASLASFTLTGNTISSTSTTIETCIGCRTRVVSSVWSSWNESIIITRICLTICWTNWRGICWTSIISSICRSWNCRRI